MPAPAAITFEHVSKHYRGARTYRALRDDVMSGLGRVVGVKREPRGTVVALDDVSFEVRTGESFALVGLNGAGKTTALKLATRISYPSHGSIKVRGRVGALIEVGTGMHPELTGRENIRLYGRILGLSGRQIASRFDEIVEFAGISEAIDRPVKQFSSGMQLRLGFSVAAHLEPDVLLVDEAIAVGDAGFQYRCVERMSQLVREGCTLVFVSHDMSAVENLCERAILLEDGKISFDGPAREAVRQYLLEVHTQRLALDGRPAVEGTRLKIPRVALLGPEGDEPAAFQTGGRLTVRLHYDAAEPISGPIFSIGLVDGRLGPLSIATMLADGMAPTRIHGEGFVDCTFVGLPLLPRTYEVWISVRGEAGYGDIVDWQRVRLFRVADTSAVGELASVSHQLARAPVTIPYHWTFSAEEAAPLAGNGIA
jgi:ABC-type polysaccharide/polyol phosphate transport system ATPase subunit